MIVSERLVPAFYAHNYLGLSRVQLFIVGSYYGAKIYQDEPFSLFNKLFVLAGAVLFVANIWTVASGRGELHPALIKLFTPIPLMVAAAWILGCFKFDGKVNNFFEKGRCAFVGIIRCPCVIAGSFQCGWDWHKQLINVWWHDCSGGAFEYVHE